MSVTRSKGRLNAWAVASPPMPAPMTTAWNGRLRVGLLDMGLLLVVDLTGSLRPPAHQGIGRMPYPTLIRVSRPSVAEQAPAAGGGGRPAPGAGPPRRRDAPQLPRC